ncbi:MAG: glycoside hydrolase family 2 protein [Erysipelotrichaceae bacterium]|nr:glycoside hydrolase family 2 protein [Erysipelotrichaceae bacterium]
MKRMLNNGWEFISEWNDAFLGDMPAEETVRIPHTVKVLPLHYIDPDDYQMISGYRKKIDLQKRENRRYFVTFDGAAHIAVVYFNGEKVAEHRCGYTGFTAEVTPYVKDGENTIVVKLDSTENGEVPPFGFVIDYLTYGGIYRNVYFEEKCDAFLKDVFVTTPSLNSVKVELEYDGTAGDEEVRVLIDKGGVNIRTFVTDASCSKCHFNVDDALPWSPQDPQLYTCRVELVRNGEVIDEKDVRFGFRTLEYRENDFLLNGESCFIYGLNRHQCYPYVGYAVPDALQKEDARILKEELHVNAVRTSHYPQSHAFLDACDELGLLVFTEIPGWQHIGGEEWKKQAVINTEEMVLQYRNHTSIILWGVRINESMDDDELYKATNETSRRLDPSRPTSGVRYLEKSSLLEDVYSYNDFSHSGANPGVKKKKDVTPDMKKPLIISEANGHMFPTKSFDTWEKRQKHAMRHATVLNDAMKDGEHIGAYQWCMFDYATHKDFGSGDRICYHGVMDSFRNPKLAASVYASQCDDVPVLEIGSSMDIGEYAASHIDQVYAFTNADELRLYKNDDFVGAFHPEGGKGMKHKPILIDDFIGQLVQDKEGFPQKQADLIHECLHAAAKYGLADLPLEYKAKLAWCMLHYKMKYEEGVRLYGKYVGGWGGENTLWKFECWKDGVCSRTVIKGPSTKLAPEVKVSHKELKEGDCYDMAAVRIRLLDEYENLAVFAQLPVHYETTGELELVGPSTSVLEGGMTGTYVRTNGNTGEGILKITVEGLKPVEIRFTIK